MCLLVSRYASSARPADALLPHWCPLLPYRAFKGAIIEHSCCLSHSEIACRVQEAR